MTSQSKLDPFSWIAVHGPKSAQLPGVDSELPRTEKTEETYTTLICPLKLLEVAKSDERIGGISRSTRRSEGTKPTMIENLHLSIKALGGRLERRKNWRCLPICKWRQTSEALELETRKRVSYRVDLTLKRSRSEEEAVTHSQ